MATLVEYNYDTKFAVFSIDSAEDIEALPTTHDKGTVNGIFDGVASGSVAYLTDGSFGMYTLDGSDNWNAEV